MPSDTGHTFESAPYEELFTVLLRQFKRPLKTYNVELSDDDFRSGRATVSRTLAILRAAYTPLPGSPVLGGGDPRDGDGNFIGAIGDGTLADDQFGRFAGGTP